MQNKFVEINYDNIANKVETAWGTAIIPLGISFSTHVFLMFKNNII